MAGDLDAIADFERLRMIQVAGRDHFVATPQFVVTAPTRAGDTPAVRFSALKGRQVNAR